MTLDNVNSVKTKIELIHLDYLCTNFQLTRPNNKFKTNNFKPDLISTDQKHLFELKSRNFPENQTGERKRVISDFAWWQLWEEQTQNYREFSKERGVDKFWIFLLSQTEKELSKIESLNEKSIRYRDIYVLPWDAYTLSKITNSNQRYIGLAKIKKKYNFSERVIKKGKLLITNRIINKINKYF